MAAAAVAETPLSARKVVIHLRATGDAPILKQNKFKVSGSDKFVKIIEFLRGQLHRDTLFVYVNSAFSPNPDELIIDLYNQIADGMARRSVSCHSYARELLIRSITHQNNFGFDGKLVVNYACSMAWG